MNRSRTFLDSASLADLSYVLDQKRLPDRYEWAYQCAFETTSLFIATDSVRIAPAMSRRVPEGVNAELRTALATQIRKYAVNRLAKESALAATKSWASIPDNQALVAKFVDGSFVDPTGTTIRDLVVAFMDNERRYWAETVVELGGVFDEALLIQISEIINESPGDLVKLQRLVADQPAALVAGVIRGDRLRAAERAFLASVLLRGYFRDAYARQGQVLHHPYRSSFLSSFSSGPAERVFDVTNSTRAVAAILIEASMRQKSGRERVNYFANTLGVLRGAAAQGRLNLEQLDRDDTALSDAADTMIKLGIRTRSPSADKWIDVFFGGGIAIATAFTLTPWASLVSGLATSVVSGLVGVGSVVGESTLERRYRLVQLGHSGLGRLNRFPSQQS